jgi:hypothetical protein
MAESRRSDACLGMKIVQGITMIELSLRLRAKYVYRGNDRRNDAC